jgi:hypothetical protein
MSVAKLSAQIGGRHHTAATAAQDDDPLAPIRICHRCVTEVKTTRHGFRGVAASGSPSLLSPAASVPATVHARADPRV